MVKKMAENRYEYLNDYVCEECGCYPEHCSCRPDCEEAISEAEGELEENPCPNGCIGYLNEACSNCMKDE